MAEDLLARIERLDDPSWEALLRRSARVEPRLVAAWQVAGSRDGASPSPLAHRAFLTRQLVAYTGDSVELLRAVEDLLEGE